MIGRQVPAQWTTATPVEALRAISDAHLEVFGERPPLARLLIIAGQSDLETGGWQKSRNYSLGGVKATASWAGDYAVYPTHEVINGESIVVDQPFRAFPTLAAGAADWLGFLKQDRFAAALERADAYDPMGYAAELKKQRYYTSDAALYGKGVRARAGALAALPVSWVDLIKLPPTPAEGGGDVGLSHRR